MWDFGLLGAAGGIPPAYELIESSILTSDASSVTFSSIPQDYKHLQVRYVARSSSTVNNLFLRLNGVTTSSYAYHQLFATSGGSVFSQNASNQTSILFEDCLVRSNQTANAFAMGVIDLLDYASTVKNTTTRTALGRLETSRVQFSSGLFNNTNAITSLTLQPSSLNFVTGSRFSLYGIKG